MKRTMMRIGFAFLVVSLFTAGCPSLARNTIVVSNNSSHTITAIFVTPTSDPSWRLSWLDEPLLPGHEWSLHLQDDMYDVRILDDRPPEGAYYEWFEIELRGGSQHNISWVDAGGQQPL